MPTRRQALAVGVSSLSIAVSGCIEQLGGGDDNGDNGVHQPDDSQADPGSSPQSSEPEPEPEATFTVRNMYPAEGYMVKVDVTVADADEIHIIHNGDSLTTITQDGRHAISGDGEILSYADVREGDSFQAMAVYDGGDMVEELATTYAV